MDKVTVSSIQGNGIDGYQVLVESGKVVKASKQEWIDGGEKLLVKLQVAPKASEAIDQSDGIWHGSSSACKRGRLYRNDDFTL